MSYGSHVSQSHSMKSLSSNNYVHSSVYGSSKGYLPKSSLPAFKKLLSKSINKCNHQNSVSSLGVTKSLTQSRDIKCRSSLLSSTNAEDKIGSLRTISRFPRTLDNKTTSSLHRNGRLSTTKSTSLSGSVSSLNKSENTFARLGLYPTHSSKTLGHLTTSSSGNSLARNTSNFKSPYFESSSNRKVSERSFNKSKHGDEGTSGLVNIGNTCFMNSIIQCLSNTKQIRDFCLTSRYKDEINPNSMMRGNLLSGFVDLIRQLWNTDQSVVTTKHFKSQIQKFSPRFMGYEQQDSQEFLRFLLEGLHEEINKVRRKSNKSIPEMAGMTPRERALKTWGWYKGKDDSFIFDLFVGQLESSLKCKECNHVSLTYDPFWDLSLPVMKVFMASETTLQDCLQAFAKEETLDNDEKPVCDRCKVRRRMTKKLSIHRFPPLLVLHLKRFSEGSRFRQKLSHMVKFPLNSLDLSPFASSQHHDNTPPVYDLYAVSNHIGSCYGGHYTAYCCNPSTKQWNNFNDSSVKAMDEGSVCTKEAYVLFYQLRKKSSRL